MQFVKQSDDGEIRILALSRGKSNAMNLVMVEELNDAVSTAQSDYGVRGIVFTSAQPRFFSSGFDVEEVFGYDPKSMRHFFGRFIDLYDAVLRMPKPVIGALPGHAYAGGAFLALAFDMRIVAEGEYGFAVNEINLGVTLPPSIRQALIHTVGARAAVRMIQFGESINPAQALEIRLADEVVAEDQVLPTALKHAHVLAQKPGHIYGLNKRAIQRDLGFHEKPDERTELDAFVAQWFSPECIERRRALTASLKARSANQ